MRRIPSRFDRGGEPVGVVHCWYSAEIVLPEDVGTPTPEQPLSAAREQLYRRHPDLNGAGFTDSSTAFYIIKSFLYRGTITTYGERREDSGYDKTMIPRRKLWMMAENLETLTEAADKLGLPLGDLSDAR